MLVTTASGVIKELRCDRCGMVTDTLHRTRDWDAANDRPMWVCDACHELLGPIYRPAKGGGNE